MGWHIVIHLLLYSFLFSRWITIVVPRGIECPRIVKLIADLVRISCSFSWSSFFYAFLSFALMGAGLHFFQILTFCDAICKFLHYDS